MPMNNVAELLFLFSNFQFLFLPSAQTISRCFESLEFFAQRKIKLAAEKSVNCAIVILEILDGKTGRFILFKLKIEKKHSAFLNGRIHLHLYCFHGLNTPTIKKIRAKESLFIFLFWSSKKVISSKVNMKIID